ncbi:MAG TPA: glycosyltransferase [Terriglobia bacterium]|nr:glycosyltransferase [Terriglobia bacterium]
MALNILFLHAGDDWIRGSEIALLTLFQRLSRERIRPFLICSHRTLGEIAQREGVSTEVYPIPQFILDRGCSQLPVAKWAAGLKKILSLVEKWNIQLLYSNGGSPCQLAYYAGKIRKLPVICHVHCPYSKRYILFYRFHRADKVVFVSEAVQRKAQKKVRFRSSSEVVYCGIDAQRFRPALERRMSLREELSLPQNAFVFGQISSLIPRKGIDLLLRAFALVAREHDHARLVLVGDGPQSETYLALARELGIVEKVRFAGFQPDPLPFYQHVFDVHVLASRSEALPLCLMEAAACGLPSLATRVDGIPEAVIDNETGFLFEREDYPALADRMKALISSPALLSKLGCGARKLAEQKFSQDRYVDSIDRIIVEQAGLAEHNLAASRAVSVLG